MVHDFPWLCFGPHMMALHSHQPAARHAGQLVLTNEQAEWFYEL